MRKWRTKLARALELPESALGRCPYLVLEADSSLRVDECLEILSYEEDEIALRLRGLDLTVGGCDLTMRSYASRSIRIGGMIRWISLSERKTAGSRRGGGRR